MKHNSAFISLMVVLVTAMFAAGCAHCHRSDNANLTLGTPVAYRGAHQVCEDDALVIGKADRKTSGEAK